MRGSLALTISHCREDAPYAGSRCAGCRGRRCHRPRAEYPPTVSTSTRTLKSSPVSNHQLVCRLQKNEALVVGGRRPTGPGARRRKLPRSTSAWIRNMARLCRPPCFLSFGRQQGGILPTGSQRADLLGEFLSRVAVLTNKEIESQIPNYPNLLPQLICQLHNCK